MLEVKKPGVKHKFNRFPGGNSLSNEGGNFLKKWSPMPSREFERGPIMWAPDP